MAMKMTTLAGILLAVFASVRAEKFTALKDLEGVLIAEHGIAHDLREYIHNEELRLDNLKQLAADFERHSAEALQDPVHHLGNPVNAFLLVKRFTTDWENIMETMIKSNYTQGFVDNIQNKAEDFPSSDDLSGAATALLRLQDTYKLSTADVAHGNIQGVKQSPVMTAQDCFELGRMSYNSGDHYHSIMWMNEALTKDAQESIKTTSRAVILDYLSFSVYMQGNPRAALNYTIDWLTLEPDHVRAQNNKRYYEQMLADQAAERRQTGDNGPHPEDEDFRNEKTHDDYRGGPEFMVYEALCRDEETHDRPYIHHLTCQFRHHHPIYMISPLREEVMSLDPFIAVYHDLITESEIAKIKELASPRLRRSVVYHKTASSELAPVDYRVSKNAWLEDREDYLIARLSKKSSILVNLTLETVESLQVVNYGIGGHYEPHYDFARPEEVTTFTEETGNRIATVIYYMTDVEAGGFTVFPEIGVKLRPSKGACAVWYNLKRNGEGDYNTRHAACPVLTGTKWICNKWFHERGQEFIRPCSTNELE